MLLRRKFSQRYHNYPQETTAENKRHTVQMLGFTMITIYLYIMLYKRKLGLFCFDKNVVGWGCNQMKKTKTYVFSKYIVQLDFCSNGKIKSGHYQTIVLSSRNAQLNMQHTVQLVMKNMKKYLCFYINYLNVYKTYGTHFTVSFYLLTLHLLV